MIGGRGTMGLIGEYLHVIRNKIWIMLICLAAVMGVTAYITFRQPEVYEATCKIMYKKGRPASALTPGSPQYLFSPYFDTVTFETERHIIKGEGVAAGVVQQLDLAGGDDARKAWIDRVKNSISVSKEKDSRIYLITARGPDPRLVRDLANTVAEVYIALSLGEKKDSAQKTLTLLTAQLEDLKNQIKKSRLAMIDYVRRRGAPESEPGGEELETDPEASRDINILADLQSQLVNLEIERGRFLIKYKEKHPKVRKVDRQIANMRTLIEAEQKRLNRAREKAIEYGILQKEVQANEDLYNVLLKKLTEIDTSKEEIESNISIIQRARLPGAPIAPQKKKNLLLGALLGLALGLGAVFATEYFDSSLQTPDEVESYLELPVLAAIPRLTAPRDGNNKRIKSPLALYRVSELNPTSHGAEMFTRLRTNLRLKDSSEGGKTMLITSSSPREGKTTVCVNLAVSLAQAGSKTVILDADLRRPRIGKIFELPDTITGISAYLKGEAGEEEIIHPGKTENLSLIPVGETPYNPAELLESDRMKELLNNLKKKFDWIILDSPPAGVLADTSILSSLVDEVLLVCFAGQIHRKFILDTVGQLNKCGADIQGVILNYIKLKLRSYHYYYGSLYRYVYR